MAMRKKIVRIQDETIKKPIVFQEGDTEYRRIKPKKRKPVILFGVNLGNVKPKMSTRPRHLRPPSHPLPFSNFVAFVNDARHQVFLTSKILEAADVNPRQNRLFVPACPTLLNFLTKEETKIIERETRDGKLDVDVFDPFGRRYDMSFKNWRSLNKLVLIKEWNVFVRDNNLVADHDVVELWCFRSNCNHGKLCFYFNIRHGIFT
ncbi:B3 domain-containing protein At2g31720-like [Dillenia turbinata]|uniref:B3 domain-containing protein At2g31720-like n=1 Tax=Dillenia turbinata TaxID=194707 RepID=A0AAN8YYV1_9MAGN